MLKAPSSEIETLGFTFGVYLAYIEDTYIK